MSVDKKERREKGEEGKRRAGVWHSLLLQGLFNRKRSLINL